MSGIEFKKGQTVVFDGDSGTSRRMPPGFTDWAYLRMMNWDRNWANIFEELMFCWKPELAIKYKNVAVGGAKSYCINDRFDEFVKPHNPDWVFLTIGGNDIAVGLTPEESQANVKKYIKRIQDECGGNLIYISRFQAGPHCPQKKVEQGQARAERYDAIEETVKECGAYIIDVGAGLLEKSEELVKQWAGHTTYCDAGDGHYNYIGNTIIAGEVMKGLGYLK